MRQFHELCPENHEKYDEILKFYEKITKKRKHNKEKVKNEDGEDDDEEGEAEEEEVEEEEDEDDEDFEEKRELQKCWIKPNNHPKMRDETGKILFLVLFKTWAGPVGVPGWAGWVLIGS